MATHSSIFAWRIPWTEEPGWLQSIASQRVRCDWATNTHTHTRISDAAWPFHITLSYLILIISLWNTLYYSHLQFLKCPNFYSSPFTCPVPSIWNGFTPTLCLISPHLSFRAPLRCYDLKEAFFILVCFLITHYISISTRNYVISYLISVIYVHVWAHEDRNCICVIFLDYLYAKYVQFLTHRYSVNNQCAIVANDCCQELNVCVI